MAQYILEDLAERAGVPESLEIDSAATSREEIGCGVYPPARDVLERHGVRCGGHRARQISEADCKVYDHIIAMEEYNIVRLQRMFPGNYPGNFELQMTNKDRPRDVSDPWYTGDFERAYRDIREGCEALLAALPL